MGLKERSDDAPKGLGTRKRAELVERAKAEHDLAFYAADGPAGTWNRAAVAAVVDFMLKREEARVAPLLVAVRDALAVCEFRAKEGYSAMPRLRDHMQSALAADAALQADAPALVPHGEQALEAALADFFPSHLRSDVRVIAEAISALVSEKIEARP